MLPDATLPVPASLMTLLAVFSPLFTAPSLRTFTMLACGFLAHSGRQTVCGMLTGAGLSRLWPHDRAHYFFSRGRWTDVPRFWLRVSCGLSSSRREGHGPCVGGGGDVEQFEDFQLLRGELGLEDLDLGAGLVA